MAGSTMIVLYHTCRTHNTSNISFLYALICITLLWEEGRRTAHGCLISRIYQASLRIISVWKWLYPGQHCLLSPHPPSVHFCSLVKMINSQAEKALISDINREVIIRPIFSLSSHNIWEEACMLLYMLNREALLYKKLREAEAVLAQTFQHTVPAAASISVCLSLNICLLCSEKAMEKCSEGAVRQRLAHICISPSAVMTNDSEDLREAYRERRRGRGKGYILKHSEEDRKTIWRNTICSFSINININELI